MSLLTDAMESFVLMDKTSVPDGYGGITRSWKDGAAFKAAAVLDTSIQARVGAVQGVTSLYTITTPRAVHLEYHDVFRRLSDGKIFRATSDGDDKHTPVSTDLDMRQVSAEEFKLTE